MLDVAPIPVALPGLRASRFWVRERYQGVKENYVVARVETGISEWFGAGKVWQSRPGSIVVKRPGDVHRDLGRDGPVQLLCVVLPTARMDEVLGQRCAHQMLEPGDPSAAPFHQLTDAVNAGADAFTLDVLMQQAIAALGRIADHRTEPTRPVRRAVEMLRQRLSEPLSLDELARHAGLDKFHLCRAFAAQIGMPPHAYRTRLRIARAKQLLAKGMRPRDVAPEVGLYDQSQLNRYFKRLEGMTPVEYARSVS